VSSGYDKIIRFHDLKQLTLRKSIESGHAEGVIALVKLARHYFATASDDFTIKVW
jgi:hypothetical protein